METKLNIGLVLSGGGARGIAHLGVLQAMEELDVRPTMISGTSSGAIIGAFYAAGYTISDIIDIVKNNSIFHFGNLAWSSSGLLDPESNEDMYRDYFGNSSFEDLQIPLYISATDLLSGKTVCFSKGSIPRVIASSSAIPGLFEPVKYEDCLLIDGSSTNCFPVEPLVGKCDYIIGVYVNPVGSINEISGIVNILDRALHLALYNEVIQKKKHCDLLIEPPMLVNYSMFDLKKVDELIAIGYNYTKQFKDKLLQFVKP